MNVPSGDSLKDIGLEGIYFDKKKSTFKYNLKILNKLLTNTLKLKIYFYLILTL